MKQLIFFLTIVYCNIIIAQNVGIGTPTPGEKLDVNGNINVAGNLKLNGNAGKAGQVLMMNSSGQQSWADVFGYRNRQEFSSSGTFTVPAGVREIMIEVIGAGGGGAKGGGGGGGAYAIGVYKVAPGDVIFYTVAGFAQGAVNELSLASDGGVSFANNGSAIQCLAEGGYGADYNRAGVAGNGFNVSGDSLVYRKTFAGQMGQVARETYSQRTATEFVTARVYGDGGACMYNPAVISRGTFFSFNTNTLLNLSIIFGGPAYGGWGSGGGGGNTVLGNWGFFGNQGMVAISW
jgi:hypothetical protein